jgi:hypothetical protein
MWAVWRLARAMVPPRVALLAALCLDGLVFFTYDAAEFSNNIVLTALWAVAVWCFYRAVRDGRAGWWATTGLVVGLALLTKYTVVFLLVPMVLFLAVEPAARRWWRRPGPYLALLVAVAVFAPHLVWMVRHHFITITYAMERSEGGHRCADHLTHPLFFALSQAGRLLPVCVVLLPLTSWRWRWRPAEEGQQFNRSFLLWMAGGPVALHLLLSAGLGLQLREIYGYPLWSLTGLVLLSFLRVDLSRPTLVRAAWCWAAVVVAFVGFTVLKDRFDPVLQGEGGRIRYPGRDLAQEVTRRWQERYGRPFPLVAGDCWAAGNVGCYAPHRPSVYFSRALDFLDLDPRAVPWTSDEDLRRRGGVLVWNADALGDWIPWWLWLRFPTAVWQPPLVLPYKCKTRVPPARVGLAFLPPRQDTVAGK